MIYNLTKLVSDNLTARLTRLGTPLKVRVFYGHERLDRKTTPENFIQVIDDETGSSDSYDYAAGQSVLKKNEFVSVTIMAHDSSPGATENMHRRMAKTLADVFMTLWVEQSHTFKHCSVSRMTGGFQPRDQNSEVGATYTLNFQIVRSVPRVADLLANLTGGGQVAQPTTQVGTSDGAGGITGSEHSCG